MSAGGRGRAGPKPARRRLARALLVLAVAVVAAMAAGAAGRIAGSSVLREAAPSLWDAAGGRAGADEELPEGFEEEVLAVAGRDEVRANARAGLVGFASEEGAEESFSAVSEELAARGWRSVGGGMLSCGTFAKEDGSRRWLFVSCVQAGEGASVVVQCEALAEERS